MIKKSNILVVANMPQRFSAQILLIDELKKINPNLNFSILIDKAFINEKQFEGHKIIVANLNQANSFVTNIIHFIRYNVAFKILRRIFFSISLFIDAIFEYQKLNRQYNDLFEKIKDYKFDLVILNGDRHLGFEQVVIKIAQELHIKTLCPYMVYSDDVSCISNSYIRQLKWYSPLILRFLMKKYPNKMLNYNNQLYTFYNPSHFLALKWFGTLSSYPWYIGCGRLDLVCVDNKNTYNRYIKNGVDKHRLKIIGDVTYDILYEKFQNKDVKKNEILRKYKLDQTKKTIICALPQLLEHNLADEATHWNEINFLVNALGHENQNVLLSLHPKMDYVRYKYLEDKFKVKILDEPLNQVLAIADLFISTFSSTVIWSVLCGIPSIVVDFYDFNFDMYDFLNSVNIVDEKPNLKNTLQHALESDSEFTNDWQELSKELVFDGNTIERYHGVMNEMILPKKKIIS